MEEDQINREVTIADLHRILRADEAEVAPQLSDEAPQVLKQRSVEVGLRVFARKAEEFEAVGALEGLDCSRVHLCHRG